MRTGFSGRPPVHAVGLAGRPDGNGAGRHGRPGGGVPVGSVWLDGQSYGLPQPSAAGGGAGMSGICGWLAAQDNTAPDNEQLVAAMAEPLARFDRVPVQLRSGYGS